MNTSMLLAQPMTSRLVENNYGSLMNGSQSSVSPAGWNLSEDRSAEKKSVATAVVYSLLLPGMGELYTENYGIGKYFTIAEGALWVSLIGVDRYANWLQDDARQFAAQHASVSINGKDDQYFVDIGNYDNVAAYNAEALRERDALGLYNERSGYNWDWDNDANRQHYSDMRVNSDEWFNSTRFVVAAIAINHLVSAINAARLAIAYNHNIDQAALINVRARIIGGLHHPDGVMITLSKSF